MVIGYKKNDRLKNWYLSLLSSISKEVEFPSNIAYPIGGPNADFKYFYYEIHFNNPDIQKGFFYFLNGNELKI